MNLSQKILSELAIHMKYARYLKEESRRETWHEIVSRTLEMHLKKFPDHAEDINNSFHEVYEKRLLPSMRSLQFGGLPIWRNPARIYNCAYLPIEHTDAFSETMFLLLGGTGVGYSVQYRHIGKLPAVKGPKKRRRRFKIGDSIEGWADAVKVLVESYFYGKLSVDMDYSDIREKGSELVVTGGKAPGPAPLMKALAAIEGVLRNAVGRAIKPIEAHDIMCHIADAVLAGGIRRAAMISLFSYNDWEMMNAKTGHWWDNNPQRGRANNSVILLRTTSRREFDKIWRSVRASGSGEPGVYWTNDLDWGTNPCAEIALRPYQFCNLLEINASELGNHPKHERDGVFKKMCKDAALIGTLQASYTDFHYLRDIWRTTTEEEALIGVGITGIASGYLDDVDLRIGAETVRVVNEEWAEKLGIKPAARCTTVKPSGTSSIVLGTSSGIHPWHAEYYLRRMRVNKDEEIWKYLRKVLPALTENSELNPDGEGIIAIPQAAPEGAILRDENPLDMLERVLHTNETWIKHGHSDGVNRNNVSATFSLKPDEWEEFGKAMYEERYKYNGISVLPYDGGSYVQAPFEDITEGQYKALSLHLKNINLAKVHEEADYTDLSGELACAGGACEMI